MAYNWHDETDHGTIDVEDLDLVPVWFYIYPGYDPNDGSLIFGNVTLSSDNEGIRIWQSPKMKAGEEVEFRTYSWTEFEEDISDRRLWLEGKNIGQTLLTASVAGSSDRANIVVFGVDLDIDSDNDDGYGHPDCDSDEEEIENDDGSMVKMGKHIHVNDYDFDCDLIPDWLDGFGAINETASDEQISDGHFPQLVLRLCVPPDMVEGCMVEFVYSTYDPAAIPPMSLEAAQIFDCSLGGLRIWRKDANERRNPGSIAEDCDFVPDSVRIPLSRFGTIPSENVFFIEGIRRSFEWGDQKIRVNVYESASDEEPFVTDEVATTVTRNSFKVCVWRPYLYHDDSQARTAYVTDETDPRTAFASLVDGMLHPDDDYHEKADFMGHAFARAEFEGPYSFYFWTGQTGMKNLEAAWSYPDARCGLAYWHTSSGWPNTYAELAELYEIHYVDSSGTAPRITNHSGFEPLHPTMVAAHEWRVMPQTAILIAQYRNDIHDFTGYGLDINMQVPRIGCGSYVGVMMDYAGLTEGHETWLFDRYMKVISLETVLPPDALSFIMQKSFYLNNARTYMDNHQDSVAWAEPGSIDSERLRYFDPAKMSMWIDQQNTKGDHKKGLTLYYHAPQAGSLSNWRYFE